MTQFHIHTFINQFYNDRKFDEYGDSEQYINTSKYARI